VLALPLVLMFRYSLNRFEPGRFMVEALTLENYVKLVSDPYYLGVLRSTVWPLAATTYHSAPKSVRRWPVVCPEALSPTKV